MTQTEKLTQTEAHEILLDLVIASIDSEGILDKESFISLIDNYLLVVKK